MLIQYFDSDLVPYLRNSEYNALKIKQEESKYKSVVLNTLVSISLYVVLNVLVSISYLLYIVTPGVPSIVEDNVTECECTET